MLEDSIKALGPYPVVQFGFVILLAIIAMYLMLRAERQRASGGGEASAPLVSLVTTLAVVNNEILRMANHVEDVKQSFDRALMIYQNEVKEQTELLQRIGEALEARAK